MNVSADIQSKFILNPLVTYPGSNPALIPDKPFLNNTTEDVDFPRNIMGFVYMDKSSGTEKNGSLTGTPYYRTTPTIFKHKVM
ncbi:MAG: hypothetical protein Q7U51_04850 [Methanoregula sp.]|nr:hypothetical protein [Methanoregula sp.]